MWYIISCRKYKVRDYCHVSGKYRGSFQWNLKLTNKVAVIFHNLRGYGSLLIMQEIGKFDVKVNVIPNGLEKYLAFIDYMQFMNSSIDALVNNLSDNDFKYLSQEFSGDLLELVKRKEVHPYECMDSFKKFSEDKLPDRSKFFNSLKDGCISEKDYSHTISWSLFKNRCFVIGCSLWKVYYYMTRILWVRPLPLF